MISRFPKSLRESFRSDLRKALRIPESGRYVPLSNMRSMIASFASVLAFRVNSKGVRFGVALIADSILSVVVFML